VQVEHSTPFAQAVAPQQWNAHCVGGGVTGHVAGMFWHALLPLQVTLQVPDPHATPAFWHALMPRHWTSQGPAPQVTRPFRHAFPPLHVTVHGPVAGHRTPLSHAASELPPVPQVTVQPAAFMQFTWPSWQPSWPSHVMSQK
jgi:hypothetical protein